VNVLVLEVFRLDEMATNFHRITHKSNLPSRLSQRDSKQQQPPGPLQRNFQLKLVLTIELANISAIFILK